MHRLTRLPACFPANTKKYVLESRGPWVVRRYIEFLDGRAVELNPRKAQICHCCAEQTLFLAINTAADLKRRKRQVEAAA